MNYSFFSLAFRQKYIRRWGLMRNTNPENLSEHSSETAIITHALAVIGNEIYGKNYDVGRAVIVALFHDVPEVFTGDLPTPVKYFNANMRKSYKDIENNAVLKLIEKLPTELKHVYSDILSETDLKLVKAADKLCAYIKCIEEEKSGNSEFKTAKESLLAVINEIDLPEVKYFIDNFLGSFYLTIDEM